MALGVSGAYAQDFVNGVVIDESGEALLGVTIIEVGTDNGAITDVEGKFSLQLKMSSATSKLKFSFIGYLAQELAPQLGMPMQVKLLTDKEQLDELVVVGYGSQKKENLTGSVGVVNVSKDVGNQVVTNTTQMLQGRLSGVQLTQTSGQPGSDGATIRIRGVGTIESGAGPMVLVDGVEMSMADVNPQDIETVTVLKDAASAAIYGTRAANGVILVTTKQGDNNEGVVNYNYYGGWQKATVLPKMANAVQYAEMYNEARINSGASPLIDDATLEAIQNGTADPDYFANTNWVEAPMQTAFISNHYLSFRKKEENTNYSMSFGYQNQDGIIKGYNAEKLTGRINVTSDIKKWLQVGMNVAGAYNNIDATVQGTSGNNGLLRGALNASPLIPIKYSNGEWGHEDGVPNSKMIKNPVYQTEFGTSVTEAYKVTAKVYARIILPYNISLETNESVVYNSNVNSKFTPTDTWYSADGSILRVNDENTLRDNGGTNKRIMIENLLRYNLKVDRTHSFNFLLGQSYQQYRSDSWMASISNIPSDNIMELDAGASDPLVGGSASEWALLSYFSRINYNYKEKYLFEANARVDGSSRFPSDNRYAVFPSFSFGWRVTEEDFMKDVVWLSNLKVRTSWGQLGNQEIGNYPYTTNLVLSADYVNEDGSGLVSGATQTALANENIKWETTTTSGIGIDAGLFKDRVRVVFDLFNRNTTDMLIKLPLPDESTGNLSEPFQNAGEVRNSGWEFAVNYDDIYKEFSYGFGFNISHVKNEIVDLDGQTFYMSNERIHREGSAINSYYGYVTDGIFQTDEEVTASNESAREISGRDDVYYQNSKTSPGDFKYKDLDGNGYIDEQDRKVLGDYMPSYTYNLSGQLSWKGISLSILMQGQTGSDRLIMTNGNHPGSVEGNNWIVDWYDNRWTGENSTNLYPKIGGDNVNSGNVLTSDFYLWNANYLRIKNIELGYNLPTSLYNNIGVTSVRVYATASNYFTFTNFKYWDPERGQSSRPESFPLPKTISLGLNITL